MTESGPNETQPGNAVPGSDPTAASGRGTGVIVAVAAVVIAVVAIVVVLLLRSDDAAAPGTETTIAPSTAPETTSVPDTTAVPDTTTPDTTAAPTTELAPETTAPDTTTAPTTEPEPPGPDPIDQAAWPWPDSSMRFTDPVEAARSFAVDYVGFDDPIVGEFRAGDARSGEVEIRSIETFTPTTVFLRQLVDDDTWWVLGSVSANLLVDVPEPGATIGSPLVLSGRSIAWEGTVDVAIRADDADDPLFEDFFTGMGAPGEPTPFDVTFEWDAPPDGLGSIVVFTRDGAVTGEVLEATVVRVRFGG